VTDHEPAALELTLTVTTTDVAAALRVAEHFSRTAFGLALDGMETELTMTRLEDVDQPVGELADDD